MLVHKHKILHRDIKPENLLLGKDGHVRICDFSEAQMFIGDDDRLRYTAGTAAYFAPELRKPVGKDAKLPRGKPAEIWALGITLYCLVAGTLPYSREQVRNIYGLLDFEMPIPDRLSDELHDLLLHMLDPDPDRRYTLKNIRVYP